jgi:hypothetical protein
MLNLNDQQGKGQLFGLEVAGLDKEVKRDRLVGLMLSGALPLIALNFFYQTLATIMIFQAYVLTSWLFGYACLVEEPENLRRSWFWKAMAALTLLHLVVLAIIFTWDRANPDMAMKALVLVIVLLVSMLIEGCGMLLILELCKRSHENSGGDEGQGST